MALTSAGGATLGLTEHITTTSAGFAKFQMAAWIKTPSAAARTILDYTSALQIKTNASNQLTLTLDGVEVGVGATVIPNDTWVEWIYRKTTSGGIATNRLFLRIASGTTLAAATTEVLIVQAVSTTAPGSLDLSVPAGCSVCAFKLLSKDYAGAALETVVSWPVSVGQAHWLCPLRFPGDTYDHREVSGSTGEFFADMHEWSSTSGTLTLDSSDPGPLLDKRCGAVLAVEMLGPLVFTAPPVPPGGPSYFDGPYSLGLSLNTDVLPSDAQIERIVIGAVADHSAGNVAAEACYVRWQESGGDIEPVTAGPLSESNHLLYYDWVHMYGPPASIDLGTYWTTSRLYGTGFFAETFWSENTASFGPTLTRRPYNLHQVGLSVTYIGASSPATAAGVIGPLVWVHMTRRT